MTLTSFGKLNAYAGQYGFGGGRNMMPYIFGYGAFSLIFFIAKLLLGVGIIALIVYLVVKVVQEKTTAGSESGKALEILKERYAKGEMGEEEFKKMKKNLLG